MNKLLNKTKNIYEQQLLTVKDVIEITKFSKSKVYRLFTEDTNFKSFKHFGNWRIKENSFMNWMEKITQQK